MNYRGITLIELLIVLFIIGLLAAIAIPGYIGVQKNAVRTEARTNLENLKLLEDQFFAENGRYAPTTNPLTRTYNGTSAADNGIEDILPQFKPGGLDNTTQFDNLNYTYTLTANASGTTFTARASCKPNRKCSNDPDLTIDQDNNRIGPW